MKKAIGIIVFGLLFCNVGFAEDKIDKLINEKNLWICSGEIFAVFSVIVLI